MIRRRPGWACPPTIATATGAGCASRHQRRPSSTCGRAAAMTLGNTWRFSRPVDDRLLAHPQGLRLRVLTDHDLHRDGLAPCLHQAVITGSHPNYYSWRMMDATGARPPGRRRAADDLHRRQRLLLGGERPRATSPGAWVRKLDSGSRAWQAQPGELQPERADPQRPGATSGAPAEALGVGFATGASMPQEFLRHARNADKPGWGGSWTACRDLIGDFGLAWSGAAASS